MIDQCVKLPCMRMATCALQSECSATPLPVPLMTGCPRPSGQQLPGKMECPGHAQAPHPDTAVSLHHLGNEQHQHACCAWLSSFHVQQVLLCCSAANTVNADEPVTAESTYSARATPSGKSSCEALASSHACTRRVRVLAAAAAAAYLLLPRCPLAVAAWLL